ncbi:MAG: hypothetical protein QXM96_03885 [Candidatus Woesearchaeota archaeon]
MLNKTFLLLISFPLIYGSSKNLNETSKQLLEENTKYIVKQHELIELQQKEIDNISNCLKTNLEYKQKIYYVNIKCDIKNYTITDNYDIILDTPTKIDKTIYFKFRPELKERPYETLVAYFKLGGSLSYEKETKKIISDLLLGIEFFSFDKLIPFYGLSMNGIIGLKGAGIALGYQFVYSNFFNNTSLMLGYSYNYINIEFYPTISITLNF